MGEPARNERLVEELLAGPYIREGAAVLVKVLDVDLVPGVLTIGIFVVKREAAGP